MSRVVRFVVFLASVFALTACRPEEIPPLVDVVEMSPREAEVGDRLELRGSGLPQGRTARVTFKGALRRAGERSVSGASIDVDGVVVSTDRIELVLGEAAVERFCGHGDHAAHTTFSGDVEVAFRSSTPGAPPLVGTLRAVTLDVRPAQVAASVTEARVAEGERLLAFLGITAGPATPRGLPIEAVKAGSPADRAGIVAGDLLSAVDGVHVAGIEDVLPSSARAVQIGVRRADSPSEEVHTIPLVGYEAARVPLEYGPALVLVALALAILLVLVAPGPHALGALELAVATRLRGVSAKAITSALFGRGVRAFASVLASLVVGTFALGPHVIAPELDGALLLVVSLALFAGSRVAVARGAKEALVAALSVAALGALLSASFAGAVLSGGAFALAELVRAQGGAPWDFAAVRAPGAGLLAFGYGATLFALARRRRAGGELTLAASADETPEMPRMLERLALVVACALGVALFFGGWQVPGAEGSRSLAVHLAGALLFVTKTWTVVAAVRGAAALVPACTAAQARSFVWKWTLPALAAGTAVVTISRRLAPSRTIETAWGALLVAALLLLVLRATLRVRAALRRPEPHASPFL